MIAQGPDPRAIALAAAQATAAARAASLGAGAALVPVDVLVDSIGQAHVRYQQTYRGIPVFEGEAIVHVDLASRSVLDVTDALLTFGAIDTRPDLGAEAARGRALGHLGLPPGLAARNALVILVDQSVAWLAWQVHVNGEDARGPVEQVAFVEAKGRGVLRSWDDLKTAPAAGTGRGFFNGIVALTTNSISGGYELRDPSPRRPVHHQHEEHAGRLGSLFTDADNRLG